MPWCLIRYLCNNNGFIHVCELVSICFFAYSRVYANRRHYLVSSQYHTITLHTCMFVVKSRFILHTIESFYQMDIHRCLPNLLNVRCASYIMQRQGHFWSSYYHSCRNLSFAKPLVRCYYHPVLPVTINIAISNYPICQVHISCYLIILHTDIS